MSENPEYIIFDRVKLYDIVWSVPIKEICFQYLISNHELRSYCKEMGIPIPKDSYWLKLKNNKQTYKLPLENKDTYYKSSLRLYYRKSDDPFITQEQDFKNLIEEIKSDKQINFQVPEKLTKPHNLISEYKRYLEESSKKTSDSLRFDTNKLNLSVGQECLNRAIIIADTIIKALEGRGHNFYFKNYSTILTVNTIDYEFRITERSKVSEERTRYDSRILEPTGTLSLEIGQGYRKTSFSDTETMKLESKLPFIIAKIELMAKQEIWEEKERRIWRTKQEEIRQNEIEIQKMKQIEIESFKQLIDNSERWNKANHLRAYIFAFENNRSSNNKLTDEDIKWIQWANEKADWYDPFIEKQVELLNDIDRNTLQKFNKYS